MASQTSNGDLHWIKKEVERTEEMVKRLNEEVGKINRVTKQIKMIIERYTR